MKKIAILGLCCIFLLLAGCKTSLNKADDIAGEDSSSNEVSVDSEESSTIQVTNYPKIEELTWEFRNTVRYGDPVAAFDYTNNSSYTIVRLELDFKMKEGVTADQLQLKDAITDTFVSDEEIAEMNPYVYDYIVCDPGEKAEGAALYMKYNTEPSDTTQCELMELKAASIYYLAEDGKIHSVTYSAENNSYNLSQSVDDPYVWIENDYTKMLPTPNTRVVAAEQYREDALGVDVYDISHNEYLTYVDTCEEMGFINKYPDEDHEQSYIGSHSDGYEIHIRYIESMHYMEITLEKIES